MIKNKTYDTQKVSYDQKNTDNMSGSSENSRDDSMSHKSSSSKFKSPRSKSSKSMKSGSTSSKSTSTGRASTEKLGMGGNSSDWIQYQARLRKSRQTRNTIYIKHEIDDSCSRASSKRSTLSKHSTSSKHSGRSTSSELPSSRHDLHEDNKGGTVKSEVVRGDKSNVRSAILKSDNRDDFINSLSDQNIKDIYNYGKMASADVTIDINN